ncbi:MAG TPA: PHP domain-containing protein [Candidatus Pullilachnospira stercoravium]|uniref:PHP domain-containing protein n=1 Tax=Candidatus Pullilachnospira stercoravium TaxID=2840913 RepID=A0A9D1NT42_9FIRM|nr:PHP domain-containing protein [Candidatus Pullilachnospira stercoravium]
MYIDFHTHGKLAKKLPFSTVYTDWLFGEAKKAGLDALCLTEHFNTLQFDELYGYLKKTCDREGDTLVAPSGLRIFAGMETDIAESGHVLSIGTPEEIMELNRRLEPHKEKGQFLPFEKLRDLFDEYEVIVGAAHPFRAGGNIPSLPEDQLRRFDFVDLNGKDVAEDRERTERLTCALGEKLQIPVVSGSDTHQAVQYGCIRTCFPGEIRTVKALYEEMKAGHYTIQVSDHAAFQVKTAGLLKRALKEIHAAGGNYVSVLTEEG